VHRSTDPLSSGESNIAFLSIPVGFDGPSAIVSAQLDGIVVSPLHTGVQQHDRGVHAIFRVREPLGDGDIVLRILRENGTTKNLVVPSEMRAAVRREALA
jgi:hypothetical protein